MNLNMVLAIVFFWVIKHSEDTQLFPQECLEEQMMPDKHTMLIYEARLLLPLIKNISTSQMLTTRAFGTSSTGTLSAVESWILCS